MPTAVTRRRFMVQTLARDRGTMVSGLSCRCSPRLPSANRC